MRQLFTHKALWLFVAGLLYVVSVSAQPVHNPYADNYENAPVWTHELKWDNVVDITDYATNPAYWDTALTTAMDELDEQGGGIVYFPEGTYQFEDDVTIPDGVILRGATPDSTNAQTQYFAPPSRLVFPKYEPTFSGNGTPDSTAFKTITAYDEKSNLGLVYLDINRGRIDIAVQGKNVLVYGVRQNNVAIPQSDIPGDYPEMKGWQRFSFRHCVNISIEAEKHASLVNCRINDFKNNAVHPVENDSYNQPGYVAYGHYDGGREEPSGGSWSGDASDTTHIVYGERAPFSYTDHYGISVSGARPDPDSLEFIKDQKIEIIDNWVYNTMRVGIFGTGYGLTIKGNIRRDKQDKRVFLHPTGMKLNTYNGNTYENRSLNFSGQHVLIENNDMRVYRHESLYSGYYTTDGESIMMQLQDPVGKWMDDVVIRDNKVNSWIGLYDLQINVRNVYMDSNNLMNGGDIIVFKKESTWRVDNLFIRGNENVTGINVGEKISDTEYSLTGQNIYIKNNSGSGALNYPCQAIVKNNSGFTDNMDCSGALFNDQYQLTPYYGEKRVSHDDSVFIEFPENLQSGSGSGISIIREDSNAVGGVSGQISENKLIIDHDPFTQPNTQYTVDVPSDVVQDSSSGTSNEAISWWFKTAPKPYPYALFPSDSAIGIDFDSEVFMAFAQDVNKIDFSGVTIQDASMNTVSGLATSWNDTANVLTISHDNFTKANEWYKVIIPAGAVENQSGFTNEKITWVFKTLVTVGIDETSVNTNIDLYPNPTQGKIYIDGLTKQARVKVYNILGNMVKIKHGAANFIDLGGLPEGVYIIHVKTGEQIIKRKVILN